MDRRGIVILYDREYSGMRTISEVCIGKSGLGLPGQYLCRSFCVGFRPDHCCWIKEAGLDRCSSIGN